MSIVLSATLAACGSDAFENTLKQELTAKLAEQQTALPLQAAMRHGSSVTDEDIGISLLNWQHLDNVLQVKIGVFFSSLIAGCSCADDPTPVQPLPEYA
jgi:hypothetical protein